MYNTMEANAAKQLADLCRGAANVQMWLTSAMSLQVS